MLDIKATTRSAFCTGLMIGAALPAWDMAENNFLILLCSISFGMLGLALFVFGKESAERLNYPILSKERLHLEKQMLIRLTWCFFGSGITLILLPSIYDLFRFFSR